MPWVRIPHLASHLLGMMIRRISADWHEVKNHEVIWLETFVDPDMGFTGACYKGGQLEIHRDDNRQRQSG